MHRGVHSGARHSRDFISCSIFFFFFLLLLFFCMRLNGTLKSSNTIWKFSDHLYKMITDLLLSYFFLKTHKGRCSFDLSNYKATFKQACVGATSDFVSFNISCNQCVKSLLQIKCVSLPYEADCLTRALFICLTIAQNIFSTK